jgi:hypothetical protein
VHQGLFQPVLFEGVLVKKGVSGQETSAEFEEKKRTICAGQAFANPVSQRARAYLP